MPLGRKYSRTLRRGLIVWAILSLSALIDVPLRITLLIASPFLYHAWNVEPAIDFPKSASFVGPIFARRVDTYGHGLIFRIAAGPNVRLRFDDSGWCFRAIFTDISLADWR